MLANFILPLAIDGVFTYNIPDEMVSSACVGMRALVPVGNKIYTGILSDEEVGDVSGIQIKDIISFLDEEPILTREQVTHWHWLSAYYVCSIGEVMKMALPAVFKLESETRVQINSVSSDGTFSPTQKRILDVLSDGKARDVRELGKIVGIKNMAPAIRRLIEEDCVRIEERVQERLTERTIVKYSLSEDYSEINRFKGVLLTLKNAPKQRLIVQKFCQEGDDGMPIGFVQMIDKQVLSQCVGFSESALRALVDKGIIVEKRVTEDTSIAEESLQKRKILNPFQDKALGEIKDAFRDKDVVLLHGVTSSGKTEIYIHLIEEVLSLQGRQVLYLLPEIALTTQLSTRLKAVFGSRLGIYHSRLSERERGEIYRRLQRGEIDVLLGVRSALFLPFRELGLIIVDEEHDSSYKQQDSAPRYHARTAAFYLAHLYGAKVLLGSATPSIETYYNAQIGKIGIVRLKHRHNDMPMPHIHLLDLQENYRRKEMKGHFSYSLVQKMSDEIDSHRQVIVFQNRRGYASQAECKQCGYVPKCIHCDVTLTVHQRQGELVCHYCGYSIPIPLCCPTCGASPLITKGFGTEQIEDELMSLFPQARVLRLDLDTTRKKNAFQQILGEFSEHKADILVGTQMVSKGLHFPNVSTVAVLNADNLMNQPSYRAYEYAFQQLEQVSGRAGREDNNGEVYIQTYSPDNPIFKAVAQHDYETFYQQQLQERKLFKYPPFYRLIEVYVRNRDEQATERVAALLQAQLQRVFSHRCSSVVTPGISKLHNQYERRILLKIEISASFAQAKQLLKECMQYVRSLPEAKSAYIFVDVEP